jgi:hypothetical protein
MSHEVLKKYVCLNPFKYLDVQQNTQWVCCPSWCPTNIRVSNNPVDESEDLRQNWFSPQATDIRMSVTDGTYRHCNHKVCPSLSQLINTGKKPKEFITIEEFKEKYDLENYHGLPENILFGFDRSCNLRCPSCRSKLVPNSDPNSAEDNIKKYLLKCIEEDFSKSARVILITGSGDPIYSKLYRDYLINFDASKYPNLESIQLISNGVLLTEKMWNSLNAKSHIKTIEISIDAGTKQTYENTTRLNGDWDSLIKNLKFLSTITTLRDFICSFVVSKYNFREMETFLNLITEIFEHAKFNFSVHFRQIVYWQPGAYSPSEIKDLQIFEESHPEFKYFMHELNKIHKRSRVNHNFHHLYMN